jgi:hypothetical protein
MRPFLIISASSILAYNQTSVSDGGRIVSIDNHSLDRCSLTFATPDWFARIARSGLVRRPCLARYYPSRRPLKRIQRHGLSQRGHNQTAPACFHAEAIRVDRALLNGTPFTKRVFQAMVERAGEAAGFDMKIHPHMLRHACGFAQCLMTAGVRLHGDRGPGGPSCPGSLFHLGGPGRCLLAFRPRGSPANPCSPFGPLPVLSRSTREPPHRMGPNDLVICALPDLASEVCTSVSRTISLLRSPLLENSPQLFGEVVAW